MVWSRSYWSGPSRLFQWSGWRRARTFSREYATRIHGPEKPLNMPEAHPAVQVGEAEASACDGHPQKGPGHVPRHPHRPSQDPVHRPLRPAKARRARRHGLVDIVQG